MPVSQTLQRLQDEIDKLVDEATAETDTTKRNEIFRQCYEMIKEDVPAMPAGGAGGMGMM